MSSTSNRIGELYSAAYQAAKLSTSDRRGLMERALEAIADQREVLKNQGNVALLPPELLARIKTAMKDIDAGPDVLIAHLLFECADEIRRLRSLVERQ